MFYNKFNPKTRSQIATMASHRCTLCQIRTPLKKGEAGHIYSGTLSKNAPRSLIKFIGFHCLTNGQIDDLPNFINSKENGAWFCKDCHKEIDNLDNEYIYNPKLLFYLKNVNERSWVINNEELINTIDSIITSHHYNQQFYHAIPRDQIQYSGIFGMKIGPRSLGKITGH